MTLVTPHMGKLRALAKGGRKLTSKLGGHVEILTCTELALHRGRNLDIVTQAETVDSLSPLKANLEALSKGIYLAELMDGFAMEGTSNSELYNLFLSALLFLCENPDNELVLRHFEIHLLRTSGFMPELQSCVGCRTSIEPNNHLFNPQSGGVLCASCASKHPEALSLSLISLKVLRFLQRSDLKEVMSVKIPNYVLHDIRYMLSYTIRYWLERELRSVTFLEHLETGQIGQDAKETPELNEKGTMRSEDKKDFENDIENLQKTLGPRELIDM